MLFHCMTTLVCALSIVAHAAASPTRRNGDVCVVIDSILNNATVNVLDQRDDLIVRAEVAARHVLDNVELLSQKRDDGSLISIDIGQWGLYSSWWLVDEIPPDVDNLLNNASISVMSQ
ncbi:hypothetical protein EDB19DRAFT_1684147 [Suillus lakei]|nr:hypothetical protein EDB19DRAFT_1684147 [Suillus lakei]